MGLEAAKPFNKKETMSLLNEEKGEVAEQIKYSGVSHTFGFPFIGVGSY